MALSAIPAAVGIGAAIVVLIYLISPPGFPTFGTDSGFDVDLSRKLGVYLGLIATLGIAAGGWMAMQEEATAFGAGADRAGTGGGPPPPPPSGGPPPASGGPAA